MDLIYFEQQAFQLNNCKNLIKFFEDNKDKATRGEMGNAELDNLEIKCDFNKSNYFGLRDCLIEETEKFKKTYPLFDKALGPWYLEAGFQLCKFLPNDYYKVIHCEQDGASKHIRRVFVWMVYLNDIKNGGQTEFLHQHFKTQAKAGNLYIWPAGPTHMHRGVPSPDSNKYFATGWFRLNE